MSDMFSTDSETLIAVVVATALALGWAIVVIRLVGLRSLSKMSAFDFVVTIGLGTIVGGTAARSTSFWNGLLAFGGLLFLQWLISHGRRRTPLAQAVDNRPIILMRGEEILHDNLDEARVTVNDLYAKLREANVTHLDQVHAVILEGTGDVSVMHGNDQLDDRLLTGVAADDPPADA